MADPSSSLTPEKRLLHLIESGGKGEAASGALPAGGGSTQSLAGSAPTRSASLKAPVSQESLFEKISIFLSDFRANLGIKTVNRTARYLLIGLALVTLGNALYEMKTSGRDPLFGLDAPERKVTPINDDEPVFDASKISDTDTRNVFMPFAKRDEMLAAKPVSESAGRLVEMTKTLKLTGISYNPDDEKTTYCMIEDLQKNITVFLRVGDQISGMKVGKIQDESVELTYENDKIEIR